MCGTFWALSNTETFSATVRCLDNLNQQQGPLPPHDLTVHKSCQPTQSFYCPPQPEHLLRSPLLHPSPSFVPRITSRTHPDFNRQGSLCPVSCDIMPCRCLHRLETGESGRIWTQLADDLPSLIQAPYLRHGDSDPQLPGLL